MASWNEEIKKELGACGENVFIGHNTIITQPQNVYLGDNVRIDPFTLITSKLVVKNYVQICAYAMLGGSYNTIFLEDWTFIGYGSKLFTNSEDYSGAGGPVNEFWGKGRVYKGDITLNKYAGIASDVMVFPGIEFPEGTCIGAKSLVTRTTQLDPYKVYTGNPLKWFKNRDAMNIQYFANNKEFIKDKWQK